MSLAYHGRLAAQLEHDKPVPTFDVGERTDNGCLLKPGAEALLLWNGGRTLLRHGLLPDAEPKAREPTRLPQAI
jgi:hypothetical protein